MEREIRRPWDVISILIGVLACAIGVIAMQHSDFQKLESKIDNFQAEMRDIHGRVARIEVMVGV